MGAVTKGKARGKKQVGAGSSPKAPAGKPTRTATKGTGKAQRTTPASPAKRSAPQPPVDPETDPDLLDFLRAVDHYKRQRSRPFPSYSELLTILRSLGWRRIQD